MAINLNNNIPQAPHVPHNNNNNNNLMQALASPRIYNLDNLQQELDTIVAQQGQPDQWSDDEGEDIAQVQQIFNNAVLNQNNQ